jgi:hypothetical protein
MEIFHLLSFMNNLFSFVQHLQGLKAILDKGRMFFIIMKRNIHYILLSLQFVGFAGAWCQVDKPRHAGYTPRGNPDRRAGTSDDRRHFRLCGLFSRF